MTKETRRIVILALMSALGTGLMYIEIPYPLFPWLMIDLSDVVVLVVFAVFGWKEAALVGLLKAVLHGLFKGSVGPFYLGQITAYIASMSYVFGMYLTTNKLNLNKVTGAFVTIGVVTTILTLANYLFITPSWIFYSFATIADMNGVNVQEALFLDFNRSYLVTVLLIYVPFNLLKGGIIVGAYNAINRSLKTFFAQYKEKF